MTKKIGVCIAVALIVGLLGVVAVGMKIERDKEKEFEYFVTDNLIDGWGTITYMEGPLIGETLDRHTDINGEYVKDGDGKKIYLYGRDEPSNCEQRPEGVTIDAGPNKGTVEGPVRVCRDKEGTRYTSWRHMKRY